MFSPEIKTSGRTRHPQMRRPRKQTLQIAVGIFISALCMVLALRSIDAEQMWQAFKTANYWY